MRILALSLRNVTLKVFLDSGGTEKLALLNTREANANVAVIIDVLTHCYFIIGMPMKRNTVFQKTVIVGIGKKIKQKSINAIFCV